MNNRKDCARYFREQNGYDRCFREMRKKWKSYGRIAGRVTLLDASEEECRALSGFFGKTVQTGKVSFSLVEFERALQNTRFAPISLQELLEEYFQEMLVTNKEQKMQKKQQEEAFFEQLRNSFIHKGYAETAVEWIKHLECDRKWGYPLLMTEYRKNPDTAEQLAESVGAALDDLLKATVEIPLAVLAADRTGNPHYYDRDTTAGRLLVYGLCFWQDCAFPKSAYAWRLLLTECGIAPDELSNLAVVYGIHFETEHGLHPAFEAFYQCRESGIISLEHLRGIRRAYTESGRLFVVENEMVYSHLLRHLKNSSAALLCTSGQLRTASLEILRMMAESGTQIYYSSDLDPEGMVIADKLWRRDPERVRIWRMTPADYEKSLSEEVIEDRRLSMLQSLQNPVLVETAQRMAEKKYAGYQENILEEYVADLAIQYQISERVLYRYVDLNV